MVEFYLHFILIMLANFVKAGKQINFHKIALLIPAIFGYWCEQKIRKLNFLILLDSIIFLLDLFCDWFDLLHFVLFRNEFLSDVFT